MPRSDSDEAEAFGNDKEEELDNENDAEDTDAEGELDAEGEVETEGDEARESGSDSDDDSEEGDDDNEEEASPGIAEDAENEEDDDDDDDSSPSEVAASQDKQKKSTSPASRRSLSPAFLRRSLLYPQMLVPVKSYTVETVCALPHPVATHSLASSMCMTHLLTGSDDGYIRDYDVFTACNGKNFLSQPQRQHCGIQEGAIKAPVARMWWENPLRPPGQIDDNPVGPFLSPVYSLLVHSDALWGLSGSSARPPRRIPSRAPAGSINLFTIRHDPGRVVHSLSGHLGPVSALAMLPGEKGFISAGWDGEALQWDLNTGQKVRTFSHGAQLTAVGMRPISTPLNPDEPGGRVSISVGPVPGAPLSATRVDSENSNPQPSGHAAPDKGTVGTRPDRGNNDKKVTPTADTVENSVQPKPESEAKSEASYDPLFDDEPDVDAEQPGVQTKQELGAAPPLPSPNKAINVVTPKLPSAQVGLVPPQKKPTIPLLDAVSYGEYSSDILLAASIDGQVVLWDRRAQTSRGVGRLEMSEKCPPWCLSACWSCDGTQIYAGRRNGTVDMWDTRMLGRSGRDTPRLLKTLRNPPSSGAVSSVVAFPDGNHLVWCVSYFIPVWDKGSQPVIHFSASLDNIRLWNVADAPESDATRRTTPAFKIIAGHHGGIVSQILVDVGAKFMVSGSGNRGWSGDSTRTVLVHDIKSAK
ncbi:WD40 repeat-like protein [Ramaria rubella]|nr:WD40 repeat-like protein [Ramaria rubella]